MENVFNIGTLNAQTLVKPGKIDLLLREINRFKWDVVGLAETHLPQTGEENIVGTTFIARTYRQCSPAGSQLHSFSSRQKATDQLQSCIGKNCDHLSEMTHQKSLSYPDIRSGLCPK